MVTSYISQINTWGDGPHMFRLWVNSESYLAQVLLTPDWRTFFTQDVELWESIRLEWAASIFAAGKMRFVNKRLPSQWRSNRLNENRLSWGRIRYFTCEYPSLLSYKLCASKCNGGTENDDELSYFCFHKRRQRDALRVQDSTIQNNILLPLGLRRKTLGIIRSSLADGPTWQLSLFLQKLTVWSTNTW